MVFFGGIDSILVLKMVFDVLGCDNVIVVVVNFELFMDEEFDKVMSLVEELGVNV